MSSPTVLRAKIPAWLTATRGPDDLLGDPVDAVQTLCLFQPGSSREHWQSMGYVYVGEADVTVELVPTADMVGEKIKSLRAQQEAVMVKAQAESIAIEGAIQKLLAIEMSPAPEEAAS